MIGCGAHLSELRRISSAGFGVEKAVDWGYGIDRPAPDEILSQIIPMDSLLSCLPHVVVNDQGLQKLKNGMTLKIAQHLSDGAAFFSENSLGDTTILVCLMTSDGRLAAIGRLAGDSEDSNPAPLKAFTNIHPYIVLL
jgi:tRNA pseudouridine55 synthase